MSSYACLKACLFFFQCCYLIKIITFLTYPVPLLSTDHKTITKYCPQTKQHYSFSRFSYFVQFNVTSGLNFNSGTFTRRFVFLILNLDLCAEVGLRKIQVCCENQGTWELNEFEKNPTDVYLIASSSWKFKVLKNAHFTQWTLSPLI